MMIIAIIDSGYNSEINRESIIEEKTLAKKNNTIEIINDATDTIGHGTAVANIIMSHISSYNVKYVIIKIFDLQNPSISEELLFCAMDYLCNNISCDIINISLGCTITNSDKLKTICKRITDTGTLIVAAFDNNGAISFPAAFENVIGVTSDDSIIDRNEINVYNSNIVDIGAYGNSQRIKLNDSYFSIGAGDSLACAHVTGIIAQSMCDSFFNKDDSKYSIVWKKKKNNFDIKHYSNSTHIKKLIYGKRIALFPFSKEMHSLVRFCDLLPCKINAIYDIPRSGRVGANAGFLCDSSNNNHIINNISNISLDEFDVFVLGHITDLIKAFKWKGLCELLEKIFEAGKSVYSFDDFNIILKGQLPIRIVNSIISPILSAEDYNFAPFGKLYRIGTPIIGIVGTSSSQGKYSLQLEMRKRFLEHGYKIGQIGSEPTSPLFGFDYCIPFGNDSTIELSRTQFIQYINYSLFELSQKKVDVIIVGSQSGSLTFDYGNVYNYPLYQTEFYLATNPDAVVLCINPFDTIDNLFRTVSFLESCCQSKVVGICMYPFNRSSPDLGRYSHKDSVTYEKINEMKKALSSINKPLFLLNVEDDINQLFEIVIDYLGDEHEIKD